MQVHLAVLMAVLASVCLLSYTLFHIGEPMNFPLKSSQILELEQASLSAATADVCLYASVRFNGEAHGLAQFKCDTFFNSCESQFSLSSEHGKVRRPGLPASTDGWPRTSLHLLDTKSVL